jgi:hypothetical protein
MQVTEWIKTEGGTGGVLDEGCEYSCDWKNGNKTVHVCGEDMEKADIIRD